MKCGKSFVMQNAMKHPKCIHVDVHELLHFVQGNNTSRIFRKSILSSTKSFSCLDVFVFVCALGDFLVLSASVLRQIARAIFLITEAEKPQKLIPNHHTINSKQFLKFICQTNYKAA